MIQRNVRALRIAIALISDEATHPGEELLCHALDAADALAAMIEKVEEAKAQFESGTSQHSLQKNRLQALKVARMVVVAKGNPGQAEPGVGADSR